MFFLIKIVGFVVALGYLADAWADNGIPQSLTNNQAIKYCWDKHGGGINNGTINLVSACANKYIIANQRAVIQKTRDFLKEHPEYRDGRGDGRVRVFSTRPDNRG